MFFMTKRDSREMKVCQQHKTSELLKKRFAISLYIIILAHEKPWDDFQGAQTFYEEKLFTKQKKWLSC
jgi:hypothetical protein